MGGRTYPDADTHERIVCVFPLSAADTDYTFQFCHYSIGLEYNSYTTLVTVINLHRLGDQIKPSIY